MSGERCADGATSPSKAQQKRWERAAALRAIAGAPRLSDFSMWLTSADWHEVSNAVLSFGHRYELAATMAPHAAVRLLALHALGVTDGYFTRCVRALSLQLLHGTYELAWCDAYIATRGPPQNAANREQFSDWLIDHTAAFDYVSTFHGRHHPLARVEQALWLACQCHHAYGALRALSLLPARVLI